MAPIGPHLPAPISSPTTSENRKRSRNDGGDKNKAGSNSDSDSDATGPAPQPPKIKNGGDEDEEGSMPKKPRIIGPSLPPPASVLADNSAAKAVNDGKNRSESGSESSDDDDDFGPSLPPTNATSVHSTGMAATPSSAHAPTDNTAPSKRDDWMLVPPSGGDWTSRVDPTKLKNRKFNTGKGAKGPPQSRGDATDSWHETPQEKQARLQREMMGIKDTPETTASFSQSSSDALDPEMAKRLQEYKKSRGPSLYQAHQKGPTVEKDDDPSARAFDREKDVGGGLQINATQRRDMVKKASDFSSRFSSAKYL